MSRYTTSIETIINSQSNHEPNIYDRIESGRKFLFDFDYPVPSQEFKDSFERQFCEKYWQECIGYETVPLFKMKLKQRLEMLGNEVIFKYSALQKIIDCDPTIVHSGNSTEDNESKLKSNNDSTASSRSESNGRNNNNGKNIVSDLPADMISAENIGNVKYASQGQMSANSGTTYGLTTGNTKGTSIGSTTNNGHIERIFEEYGNQLEGYSKYLKSYVNIMSEVLNSFDDMFIQLLF